MKTSKPKVLFLDPTSGAYAGAQKVTVNVLVGLSERYDIQSVIRKPVTDYGNSIRDLSSSVFDFPFESFFNSCLGKGHTDSLAGFSKVLYSIKLIFLIVISNLVCLYQCFRNKPKYVYTYDPSGLIFTAILPSIFGFKVIWHLHGELHFNTLLKNIIGKIPYKTVVPSKYVNLAISRCIPDAITIYNGFDFNAGAGKYLKPEFKNEIRLLYIGTIVPHKGLHLLLESLSHVQTEHRLALDVLGEPMGVYSDSYSKYISNIMESISGKVNVRFRGWVTNVHDYINKSDLLVFPSVKKDTIVLDGELINVRSSEALPTVLIEALSNNIPVVASDVAGVREIVDRSAYGAVLDGKPPECWAREIEKIIQAPESYRFDNSIVRKKFSLESMNKELLNVFD